MGLCGSFSTTSPAATIKGINIAGMRKPAGACLIAIGNSPSHQGDSPKTLYVRIIFCSSRLRL
uniref:Uncharacterized protein n=1 Tax=Candidatus Kentrum sp. UNK TaxID=2126344 RepID=A0A450ZWF2_9GAMM|nr:MAG: hypothetical protein BECKUNK1418G_GA0071005_100218 [Candidatus Kentron sp. UNK]VFK68259.1 MAG: hypothetical protein BECKUNK1418H_GA0071006_100118 [Candidatus Kentron sp. UNK]